MKNLSKLILAVLLLVPSLSFAKVGTRNLEEDVKHRQFCFEYPVAASNDATSGRNGVVIAVTSSVAGDSSPDLTVTSSIGTLIHPAKLSVGMLDITSDSTLACSSVVIRGTDQFGKAVSETVSTITETPQNTTTVFSTVSYAFFDECTGATSTTDDFARIWMSDEIGLTVKIASYTDVEAACIEDAGDSSAVECAASNDTTTGDIESAVELSSHTIDVGDSIFRGSGGKGAAADNDSVCLRIRSSKTTGF